MQLYSDKYSDPKAQAQSNLNGRTHYVDDDTLKYFKARVLKTEIIDGGLFFCLIESLPVGSFNAPRRFRFQIFDVYGKVLETRDIDQTDQPSYSTSSQALKAMWVFVNKLDARSYYADLMPKRLDRLMVDHDVDLETIDSALVASGPVEA